MTSLPRHCAGRLALPNQGTFDLVEGSLRANSNAGCVKLNLRFTAALLKENGPAESSVVALIGTAFEGDVD